MKLLELLVTKAYAQFPGGVGGTGTDSPVTGNSFNLQKFTFLKPISSETVGLSSILNTVIGLVLTVAALAAFFYLLIAGFQYITAGGDSAKAETARKGIVNALIGIIVILVAYVILRFVGTSIIPGTS